MHKIYCVVCIWNNKKYIGQTRGSLADARELALRGANSDGSNRYFYNAIKKYGIRGFCWGVIDSTDSPEEANKKQIFWIERLQTQSRESGYNIERGGVRPPHPSLKMNRSEPK